MKLGPVLAGGYDEPAEGRMRLLLRPQLVLRHDPAGAQPRDEVNVQGFRHVGRRRVALGEPLGDPAVEDRDLEALTRLETTEKEHRTVSDELLAVESAWTAEQADLTERTKTLAAEIAEYEAERIEQEAGVRPEHLRTYNHIRFARQGRALAKLDRNLCTGCRISLPTNIVNKARAANVLIQCPNCERILHA